MEPSNKDHLDNLELLSSNNRCYMYYLLISQDVVVRIINLCEEQLAVWDVLDPGLTVLR